MKPSKQVIHTSQCENQKNLLTGDKEIFREINSRNFFSKHAGFTNFFFQVRVNFYNFDTVFGKKGTNRLNQTFFGSQTHE